ncbi:hypothetical protein BpHYR1_031657 [Brachionus plicatilis]|uniref:HTH psq-type domain-containing protein n=1 Tax=Brachionus plicatilis TaxID=10195 RepID=A0A3M7SGE1_BRAPC|nr:hypothetical protein BpHYR1_031657 [Brachionus plicatilis]
MYQTKSRKKARTKDECSTPPSKNTRVVLNFAQKDEIIQKIGLGFSHKKVAADYNIVASTVYQLVRTKPDSLSKHREENPHSPWRNVFKGSDFREIDHALNIWFYQELSKTFSSDKICVYLSIRLYTKKFLCKKNYI